MTSQGYEARQRARSLESEPWTRGCNHPRGMSARAPWKKHTRDRIRDVQNGLLSMADWAKQSAADPAMAELLLRPYRDLLESLYERDMPLAKLADNSDLLLHVHGPAASDPRPGSPWSPVC